MEAANKVTLDTVYLLTGKESYTVFITNSRESGTSINCYAYNASYGDRLIDAVIVPPGQTVSMVVDGLSASSEVFLEFTGDLAAPELDGVIHELGQLSAQFRILGNFKGYEP